MCEDLLVNIQNIVKKLSITVRMTSQGKVQLYFK